MNEKFYTENYASYKPRQNLKQTTNESMSFYSYSNFSTNTPPNTNFMDICSGSTQNFNFQQNSHSSIFMQQEPTDLFVWEDRTISDMEKTIKILDKRQATEVCSNNLSPANYSSNVDFVTLAAYKETASKNMHNIDKFENEWYYNQNNYSQKTPTYASCAQEKFNKYCGIQSNDYVTNKRDVTSNYTYNYYDNNYIENQQLFTQNAHYFSTNTGIGSIINPIDQQSDCSNEESDIIVEESDEEIGEQSEGLEKLLPYSVNKCLVCNVTYEPLGTQFYFLTEKNPLTMSSQKPAVQKLKNIIGEVLTTKKYLCSECLGCINSIDHLQLQLEKLKSDIVIKFKRTCLENKIQYRKSYLQKKCHVNKWPKYKCRYCNKILCLKKYCLYHVKRHRTEGYLCDSCGKICSNKLKFSLHCRQHKKSYKKNSLRCSNCNKIFGTKSNQKEHENYCLNLLPFKCKRHDCDKKFPSATKLKNHVRLKHDKKFIVICSICNIGFIKMSDYKSHMISHSTDKKHSCPKCQKAYKTLSNLNFHMKIHSDNLPFICHVCSKGFMRKEYLEAHINNHNGIRNFSCTNCDKKFVSQKNLDAHLKYHEGTVKKNTCKTCGKTMTSGFEEHLRIHNNLKEFECQHCDMKFNTKGTLSKHIKKKHG